ncbi:FecCD family ABC transporter permease [Sediminivirga luteola]|uniref:ABC transporter permease n=1 Tax=Sediminivirga luteola TaxID=1774748 RepID=A0A8J2TY60_9MICO|nr:iron chelate uptake ABC transporter family permease subunit [Sediminivirga luteola]MCI2265785.1 iron chelate uptake ABC transporter family permease subunit [Sediminivirga luteola]GGA14639.1 ABC transporter permease [Sediminivirga luteola]
MSSTIAPATATAPVGAPSTAGGIEQASPPGERGRPVRGVAHNNAVRSLGLLAGVAVLVVVTLASVAIGARSIPLDEVLRALQSAPVYDEAIIVWELRIPRTIMGLAVGVALGVAGALIQAMTRNPLADPGILGVNAGAAFAVAIGITVFGAGSISGYMWFAFAGALVVTVLVYLIGSAGYGPATPVRLTLAGVALAAVLSGITTAITLLNPNTFDQMRYWQAGSVVGRGLELLWPVLPFFALGLLCAVLVARPLNAVAMGDDLARSLGANVAVTRVLVIVAVTVLAGGATALAGPIGFVGLMVPHVARWIVGPDQRWILAYTVVLAPVLLISADIIGRIAAPPGELPVGIVTAFVGAPVLILLVRRKRASGL